VSFSIRPVECYAPGYGTAGTTTTSSAPLPACGPTYQLTAAQLGVVPDASSVTGYRITSSISEDPQFSPFPSTEALRDLPTATVVLPAAAQASGAPARYVLGPAPVNTSSVQSAQAQSVYGQWAIRVTLTPTGLVAWNALAARQFHALVALVVDGAVVSAPLIQPTQASFTPFKGGLEVSGSFTEQQAKDIATRLSA
jgi:preprotein translocase subunit SecD